MRHLMTLAAATVAGLAATAGAVCIWDTDTVRDELQTKAGDFDLITGQFPHHSAGYYTARVAQANDRLAAAPDDVAARNDLAVALLKLGKFDASLAEFRRIDTLAPGRYETLSNLGVLHKKWGKYGAAADYTAKALAIKPAGHLGLGDFYLKMLRWQAQRAKQPKAVPAKTFLGYGYGESYYQALGRHKTKEAAAAHIARVKALIRSDRTFADGHFVLGDVLRAKWDLNLALWAYVRALDLGHPNPGAVQARIDEIFSHWRQAIRHRGGRRLEDQAQAIRRMRSWLTTYGQWQVQFEKTEAALIAVDGLAKVDFNRVEAELKRKRILRRRPVAAGLLPNGTAAAQPGQSGPQREADHPRSGAPTEAERSAWDSKDDQRQRKTKDGK